MPNAPDHHDADLLLRTYELRREPELRKARDFMQKLQAKDAAEFQKKYPMGSPGANAWGKVFGYWEMVCALIARGLINEELFNESGTSEHIFLYFKFKHLIEGFRQMYQYPDMLKNLETVAKRHPYAAGIEQWATSEAAQQKPKAKAKRKTAGA